MRKLAQLLGALLLAAAVVPVANATAFANSLWIGNDTNAAIGALNTDRNGVVLQTIPGISAVGFAVDLGNNRLYVNEDFVTATPYDLATLTPGAPVSLGGAVSEDLSFDGTYILAGDFNAMTVVHVDPTTGTIVGSPIPVGVNPLGLTWDGGTGFWVTGFDLSGTVYHFDAAGTLLSSFVAFPGSFAGGLAYDTTDGTLFVGTFNTVAHFTTSGTFLGSFSTPDSRFVDGLEFEAGQVTVPEPGTLALFGVALTWFAVRRRKA